MKALFLAGGMGLRLQPLTNKIPKPMIPIMNKPLLERTMVSLKKAGITEMIISTCYKPEYFINYFGDGERFGLNIQYIVEDFPLGTGGAIKKAESKFDDSFIVFNSDIVCDINIQEMIEYHRSSHAIATIYATAVENPSAYGVIECDADGYAVSFIEKPIQEMITSKYINAGIYIFKPEIFKEISLNSVVSIERETFPKILEKGYKIGVFKSNSYWIDIGTIEKYQQVHMDILSKKCRLEDNGNENIILGKNVRIHPTAKIIGPVYIGDNVEIKANTFIRNSVIGNNTSIGFGSKIVESILWNDIKVDSYVTLNKIIVTSNNFIKLNSNSSNKIITEETNELLLKKIITY